VLDVVCSCVIVAARVEARVAQQPTDRTEQLCEGAATGVVDLATKDCCEIRSTS
jgi:hypothetical protein